MDSDPGAAINAALLDKLSGKAALNQLVFDNTFAVFTSLKETLHEMSADLDDRLEELDREVKIDYRDRGKFEVQLKVADDILIFNMHSNVFAFNREHPVWQNPYVKDNKANSYCGIINIYNFLTDSFKYNRSADEGYLIGRIFVNREKQYFVEGKRQVGIHYDHFGSHQIDREALIHIIEASIDYALDFDLLVPPYDTVKIVSMDQFNTKIENSKFQTGKRLGYTYELDNI